MTHHSVLITGANRGLGLEFVKQLVTSKQAPRYVFACCRNPDLAEDVKKLALEHSSVKPIKLDILNVDSLNSAAKAVSDVVGETGLSLLINNAAILKSEGATLENVTVDHMLSEYNSNAVGPLMVTKAFLPLLRTSAEQSGLTSIINISSMLGSITCNLGDGLMKYPYRCSKAALNMVTKLLSNDLKADGIKVMSMCPGWVSTDMGGPTATNTPPDSVRGMLGVILNMTEKHNGQFYSFDGQHNQW